MSDIDDILRSQGIDPSMLPDAYKRAIEIAQSSGSIPAPGGQSVPYPQGSAGAAIPAASQQYSPALLQRIGKSAPQIAKYAMIGAIAGQAGLPGALAASAIPLIAELLKEKRGKSNLALSGDYVIPGEAKGGKVSLSKKKTGGAVSMDLVKRAGKIAPPRTKPTVRVGTVQM